MSQVNPIKLNFTAQLPQKLSNLELMKLIFKINAQIDKVSNTLYESKKEQLNIFMDQTKNHKNLKMNEGITLFSIAIVSGITGISSQFSKGFLNTALKTTNQMLPMISQAAPSIFSSYEQLSSSKKYIAQSDLEAAKNTDEKLGRQVNNNNETLSQLLRQLGSLNHLR